MSQNLDQHTVDGFAEKWAAFDQNGLSEEEHGRWFEAYFGIFPWNDLPAQAELHEAVDKVVVITLSPELADRCRADSRRGASTYTHGYAGVGSRLAVGSLVNSLSVDIL